MSDLQKGTTFSDTPTGNAVNAARLHQLVEAATILPDFIANKPDASASVADGDCLIVLQLSSGQLRKITTVSLVDKATAAATAAALASMFTVVGHSKPPTADQNANFAWIKTGTSTFGQSGLRLWDSTASTPKWRRVYNVPLDTLMAFAGMITAPNFVDGVGQNDFDGWVYANGTHGTVDATSLETGSIKYIQFKGYTLES